MGTVFLLILLTQRCCCRRRMDKDETGSRWKQGRGGEGNILCYRMKEAIIKLESQDTC